MKNPSRALLALAAGAAALSLVVSGCSSAEESTSGGELTAEGQAGMTMAQESIDAASIRPTEIFITEPIVGEIPKGKTITFLSCGTSTCNLEADVIKTATDALGWTMNSITTDGTPESVKNAWATILRDRPDGVLYSAIDKSSFAAELEQAKAAGISVTACCVTDNPDIDFVISDSDQIIPQGALFADWLTVESGGTGQAVYVTVPAFDVLKGYKTGLDQRLPEVCPGCAVDSLDIPYSALESGDSANRIVSYLRANPDVQYVVLTMDSLGTGLPAALAAAGLSDVKVVGEGPDTTTLEYIASGQREATIPFAYYEDMYAQIDALARKFAGNPPINGLELELPVWLVTQENLPGTEIFPIVEDAEAQFKALWNVSTS